MQPNQPKVLIDQQILQNAVNYLTTRPYKEVANLISSITNDAKVYEQPKEEQKPKKEANRKPDNNEKTE